MLLEAGANLEASRNSDGATPLFETVNLTETAPNGRQGYRPLWWPALITMEVLLDAGANINARKQTGGPCCIN